MDDADTWLERARDLGALLESRGDHHVLLVVGGFAMQFHALGNRTMTRDIDAWGRLAGGSLSSAAPLPESLVTAIQVIARLHGVSPDWLNTRVASELAGTPWPDDITGRATPIELGGLMLLVAARQDLIALKMAAAVQPGVFSPRAVGEKHRSDLRAMAPTEHEIATARTWIRSAFGDARLEAVDALVEEDL